MKFIFVLSSLIAILQLTFSHEKGAKHYLRRANKRLTCKLLKLEIQYSSASTGPEESWQCEMEGYHGIKSINTINLSMKWLHVNSKQIQSGETTLVLPTDALFEKGDISFPAGSNPTILQSTKYVTDAHVPKGLVTRSSFSDRKHILVVRVKAKDSSTTSTTSTLIEKVFGNGISLKERFEACSFRKVIVTGGVVEVTIPNIVSGAHHSTIQTAVTSAAETLLGDLPSQFDHVMLCLPPGTSGDWTAYGFYNYWLSVYNDEWCNSPSAQVHIVGHNLNLSHSWEGNAKFDESGMMGSLKDIKDGPKVCFNAAKSWQLGWYSDRHATTNPLNSSWNGQLVGIADYGLSARKTVILKIEAGAIDYFVNFNRQTGINSGTLEGADQVLITTKGGSGSESNLVAKLNEGEEYSIDNFAGSRKTVKVKVTLIDTDFWIGFANLRVYVEGIDKNSPFSGTGVVEECYDFPKDWHDKDGPQYNCAWYASESNFCETYGNLEKLRNPLNGKTANEACCACGGGQICKDDPNWHDDSGPDYNCAWYAIGNNCADHGNDWRPENGKTANEACCVCGGGT